MSGAAEYMDRVDHDTEDAQVLAEDGSSAAVLAEHLTQIAIQRGTYRRVSSDVLTMPPQVDNH